MVEKIQELTCKYNRPDGSTISFKWITRAYPVIVTSILELTAFCNVPFRQWISPKLKYIMIVLQQGKPSTNRFKVFIPVTQPVLIKQQVICRHPVTRVETKGVIYGVITVRWIDMPDWICLETYDLNGAELKKALEKVFPEHRNQDFVRILLIQQTQ